MVESPTPADLSFIAEMIRRERCVAFLGAGVNVSSTKYNYTGLPLGREVARQLIVKLGMSDPQINEQLNLSRIALIYQLFTDRYSLIRTLEEILADHAHEPSPLLKMIAKLPFRLIITTNYDRLMERALVEANREFRVIIQPPFASAFNLEDKRELDDLDSFPGTTLYKLHGSFRNPTEKQTDYLLSSIIVTEEDYLAILRSRDEYGIPYVVRKYMTYSSLLFLGYGLEDWDLRVELGSLAMNGQRRLFAVVKEPAEWWVRYWAMQDLEVFDVDLYDFAARLEKVYQEEK